MVFDNFSSRSIAQISYERFMYVTYLDIASSTPLLVEPGNLANLWLPSGTDAEQHEYTFHNIVQCEYNLDT